MLHDPLTTARPIYANICAKQYTFVGKWLSKLEGCTRDTQNLCVSSGVLISTCPFGSLISLGPAQSMPHTQTYTLPSMLFLATPHAFIPAYSLLSTKAVGHRFGVQCSTAFQRSWFAMGCRNACMPSSHTFSK